MSFINKPPTSHRATAIAGVAAIHAAIGIALVTGLTYSGVIQVPTSLKAVDQFKLTPPPPPPEPTVEPEPRNSNAASRPMVAPVPDLALADDPVLDIRPIDTVLPYTGTIPKRDIGPVVPPAPPSPTPSFTPTAPLPLNGPAGWITNDEYPRRALTRDWEGSLSYRLDVGANGRVESCTVTASSGYDILDETACKWVQRRARFDPAVDASGRKVAGSYRGSVTWRIPD